MSFRVKNVTHPEFKGEKLERNKDAVQTFLHKWGDIHRLRATPDGYEHGSCRCGSRKGSGCIV